MVGVVVMVVVVVVLGGGGDVEIQTTKKGDQKLTI